MQQSNWTWHISLQPSTKSAIDIYMYIAIAIAIAIVDIYENYIGCSAFTL